MAKLSARRGCPVLMTETNAPTIYRRVLRAAAARLGRGRYQADFEHGQWWLTCLPTGRQWSVVDCETQDGISYLDFELVTRGNED